VWCDGHHYYGEFNRDRRFGKGRFTFPDGRYYEGIYKDDERKGPGEFHWPNGDVWKGVFFNMISSKGTKTIALSNIRIRGEWRGLALEDGVGEMELLMNDGNTIIKGIYKEEVFIPFKQYNISTDKLYEIMNTPSSSSSAPSLSRVIWDNNTSISNVEAVQQPSKKRSRSTEDDSKGIERDDGINSEGLLIIKEENKRPRTDNPND